MANNGTFKTIIVFKKAYSGCFKSVVIGLFLNWGDSGGFKSAAIGLFILTKKAYSGSFKSAAIGPF